MNADEIVRALKWLAKETEFVFAAENLNGSAAVIESLQAQLSKLEKRIAAEGFSDLETMISKYKTVMLAANELSIETDGESGGASRPALRLPAQGAQEWRPGTNCA